VGDLTTEQRGFVGDIFGSGRHLLSLINDVLDLSKVEAGKMVLDPAQVDMPSLLSASLSIIKEKAASKNVTLRLDVANDLGPMQADARRVKQIVYNLLSNAIKFTPGGGTVTLRANRVPRTAVGQPATTWPGRSVALAESDAAEFLEISVTDNGIGITEDGLAKLFEPFSQIATGSAPSPTGTGLGLTLVKSLAELHEGTVAVESAFGVGSRFAIWLARRERQPTLPAPGHAATPIHVGAGTRPRTALVVDHDPTSAELIRVQLEAEGFSVVHATSAAIALDLATTQPFSLITMDVLMPGVDGWEFLHQIKQLEQVTRVPVVIISTAADRHKSIALGAAAVLEKPVLRQEMYDMLVELGLFPALGGHRLKILVVDDEPDAVELIAGRLFGLASTVLRAYGGREAIDIARKELPDLILLDVIMPDVNGFDVVYALDAKPETARIPILVVSGKAITADDRVKLRSRVVTILDKSEVDLDRFTLEVRRAMSRHLLVA
jgi:CheY-like chemotaxis protein